MSLLKPGERYQKRRGVPRQNRVPCIGARQPLRSPSPRRVPAATAIHKVFTLGRVQASFCEYIPVRHAHLQLPGREVFQQMLGVHEIHLANPSRPKCTTSPAHASEQQANLKCKRLTTTDTPHSSLPSEPAVSSSPYLCAEGRSIALQPGPIPRAVNWAAHRRLPLR